MRNVCTDVRQQECEFNELLGEWKRKKANFKSGLESLLKEVEEGYRSTSDVGNGNTQRPPRMSPVPPDNKKENFIEVNNVPVPVKPTLTPPRPVKSTESYSSLDPTSQLMSKVRASQSVGVDQYSQLTLPSDKYIQNYGLELTRTTTLPKTYQPLQSTVNNYQPAYSHSVIRHSDHSVRQSELRHQQNIQPVVLDSNPAIQKTEFQDHKTHPVNAASSIYSNHSQSTQGVQTSISSDVNIKLREEGCHMTSHNYNTRALEEVTNRSANAVMIKQTIPVIQNTALPQSEEEIEIHPPAVSDIELQENKFNSVNAQHYDPMVQAVHITELGKQTVNTENYQLRENGFNLSGDRCYPTQAARNAELEAANSSKTIIDRKDIPLSTTHDYNTVLLTTERDEQPQPTSAITVSHNPIIQTTKRINEGISITYNQTGMVPVESQQHVYKVPTVISSFDNKEMNPPPASDTIHQFNTLRTGDEVQYLQFPQRSKQVVSDVQVSSVVPFLSPVRSRSAVQRVVGDHIACTPGTRKLFNSIDEHLNHYNTSIGSNSILKDCGTDIVQIHRQLKGLRVKEEPVVTDVEPFNQKQSINTITKGHHDQCTVLNGNRVALMSTHHNYQHGVELKSHHQHHSQSPTAQLTQQVRGPVGLGHAQLIDQTYQPNSYRDSHIDVSSHSQVHRTIEKQTPIGSPIVTINGFSQRERVVENVNHQPYQRTTTTVGTPAKNNRPLQQLDANVVSDLVMNYTPAKREVIIPQDRHTHRQVRPQQFQSPGISYEVPSINKDRKVVCVSPSEMAPAVSPGGRLPAATPVKVSLFDSYTKAFKEVYGTTETQPSVKDESADCSVADCVSISSSMVSCKSTTDDDVEKERARDCQRRSRWLNKKLSETPKAVPTRQSSTSDNGDGGLVGIFKDFQQIRASISSTGSASGTAVSDFSALSMPSSNRTVLSDITGVTNTARWGSFPKYSNFRTPSNTPTNTGDQMRMINSMQSVDIK